MFNTQNVNEIIFIQRCIYIEMMFINTKRFLQLKYGNLWICFGYFIHDSVF